jgi:hypothetical protein
VIVTFTKTERLCTWVADRGHRRIVPGTTMAAGGDLPHDLVQFVIERAFGMQDGFWGTVADGGTFRSLARKRTQPGRAVVRANRGGLDAAEVVAGTHWSAWRNRRETPVGPALDAMLERWRALPDGGTLTLEWPVATGRRLARR